MSWECVYLRVRVRFLIFYVYVVRGVEDVWIIYWKVCIEYVLYVFGVVVIFRVFSVVIKYVYGFVIIFRYEFSIRGRVIDIYYGVYEIFMNVCCDI